MRMRDSLLRRSVNTAPNPLPESAAKAPPRRRLRTSPPYAMSRLPCFAARHCPQGHNASLLPPHRLCPHPSTLHASRRRAPRGMHCVAVTLHALDVAVTAGRGHRLSAWGEYGRWWLRCWLLLSNPWHCLGIPSCLSSIRCISWSANPFPRARILRSRLLPASQSLTSLKLEDVVFRLAPPLLDHAPSLGAFSARVYFGIRLTPTLWTWCWVVFSRVCWK